jgi:hypothetical protein
MAARTDHPDRGPVRCLSRASAIGERVPQLHEGRGLIRISVNAEN